jgi:predicted ATPase
MISKCFIRNFKCLRDVKTELERFTVLVGPNASGKSSILQAMDLLCRSFLAPGGSVESELSQAVSQGATDKAELGAELGGKIFRYRGLSRFPLAGLNIGGQAWSGEGRGVAIGPNPKPDDWKHWTFEKGDQTPFPNSTTTTTTPAPTFNQGNQSPLPLSVLLRLEASKLIPSNPALPEPTIMRPDGTGLHWALANMALNDPDSWQKLQADLHGIIPTIRRLRHTKTAMNQPAALLFDTVGADSLLAFQVSEGTLLVLGLLAALYAPGRPNLVLLDDLDRGLHPKAQKELISLLRGLMETNPDLQILAATHSPYMLDCMAANEVRMTVLRDDGATVCAPLANHPEFEKWKDEMTPGEMWSLFGEKWVVEEGATA